MNHYETNLDKNDANFVPLTPLSFLEKDKDRKPAWKSKPIKLVSTKPFVTTAMSVEKKKTYKTRLIK